MALQIVRFNLWFDYWPSDTGFSTRVNYTPIAVDDEGAERELSAYANQHALQSDLINEPLKRKLIRLTDYVVSAALAAPEVEVE